MAFRVKYDLNRQVISPLWIESRHCLPPLDMEVLVTDGENCKVSHVYDENFYKRKRARTRKDKWPISIVWAKDESWDILWEVTHWMELPELPIKMF